MKKKKSEEKITYIPVEIIERPVKTENVKVTITKQKRKKK